jgi:hypothetical protein
MNDEIRMTNDETNPNDQNPKLLTTCRARDFVIRASSYFRHWSFAILMMPA